MEKNERLTLERCLTTFFRDYDPTNANLFLLLNKKVLSEHDVQLIQASSEDANIFPSKLLNGSYWIYRTYFLDFQTVQIEE